MKKGKLYDIDGVLLTIPLRYDEISGKYMEVYPDLIQNPVYTPKGRPIMLTIEDACEHGEQENENKLPIDCGSCRFYRQIKNTLIGVCECEKKRKNIVEIGGKKK